ncbi:uncharacterized protein N7483_001028 [Penicillium malachiteum]|uniref:uncharacterized protein n=1 Tax=Penicillium malachiteum TaxID=1324776 RepID=UPI002547E690|nr:uncharacterized protein N7483_001028 [Penicillium malachiteum]KAJ5735903.1 hypothetical protein N7483_001028 [Penicillium malachiteum]
MTHTKKASNDNNPFEIKTLRKKLSQHFAGRTTTPPSTESKDSKPIIVTKVQLIEFHDTKTDFVMEIDEDGKKLVRRYDAFSVMKLHGAEEAIEKFGSHILPKEGLQRKT